DQDVAAEAVAAPVVVAAAARVENRTNDTGLVWYRASLRQISLTPSSISHYSSTHPRHSRRVNKPRGKLKLPRSSERRCVRGCGGAVPEDRSWQPLQSAVLKGPTFPAN